MIKRDELANPNSCFNRAADDEIIFVLLERDVATPHAIREWGLERVLRGKNNPDDAQIVEALECAATIAKRHDQAEDAGNSFSHNKAIHSTFPDPALAAARLGVEQGTVQLTASDALQVLQSFQRDTINTLADCLVREAGRLEAINGFATIEDLKREAQALRDYAETLAPDGRGEEQCECVGTALPRVGSAVIILDRDNRLLFGRRTKQPWKDYWVIPGGRIEPHESIDKAGVREIKEETALDIEITGRFNTYEHVTHDQHLIFIFSFARIIGGTAVAASDICELTWATPQEALNSLSITPINRKVLTDLMAAWEAANQ